MKTLKVVIILFVLLNLMGCQNNNSAIVEENEALKADNEALKALVAALDEQLTTKNSELRNIEQSINELLQADKLGGISSQNIYYEDIKDNIVNGYINYNELNVCTMEQCLSGIYQAAIDEYKYIFIAFPVGEYVLVTQDLLSEKVNITDGVYNLEKNDQFLNSDIATGGVEIWTNFTPTNSGFTIKIVPPMATDDSEGIIVEFVEFR